MSNRKDINEAFDNARSYARKRGAYCVALRLQNDSLKCGHGSKAFYDSRYQADKYSLTKALYWEHYQNGKLLEVYKAPNFNSEAQRYGFIRDCDIDSDTLKVAQAPAPVPELERPPLWWEIEHANAHTQQERLITLRRAVRRLINYG